MVRTDIDHFVGGPVHGGPDFILGSGTAHGAALPPWNFCVRLDGNARLRKASMGATAGTLGRKLP